MVTRHIANHAQPDTTVVMIERIVFRAHQVKNVQIHKLGKYFDPLISNSDMRCRPVDCATGYYALGGEENCLPCPAGAACPSVATTPIACSGGFSDTASTNCTVCPAGKSCLDPANPPVDCAIGQFSPEGSVVCSPCPAGYECPDPATKHQCTPG